MLAQVTRNQRWRTSLWIIVAMVAVVLLGIHRGVDSNWDLRNYHLYNGRALLTGTFRTDVAVAGIQSYLNPLIDVPLAGLVGILGVHRGVLLSGILLQAVAYVALWRLTRAFFASRVAPAISIAAFALAMTGSAAMSLSYTHFGEWVTAACLCEALTMILRIRRDGWEECSRRRLLIAGLWIGAAVGLKLTSVPFAFGLITAIGLLRPTWRRTLGFLGAAVIGVLLTGGFWMVWLTAKYGNPLFPFYNGIFHSPAAPTASFDDPQFGATGLASFLKFPLDMLRGTRHYSERRFPYQDWRLVGVLVLGVHAAGMLALRRTAETNQRQEGPGLVVVTVLAVGTPIWLIQFGIYRYFVFGELLVSLLIVHCITVLARQRTVLICWLTLVLIVVGSTLVHAPNWGRGLPLRVEGLNPGTPGRSTYVVLAGGQPIGYLTSSFAAHTHFLALSSFAESGNDGPGRLYLEGPLRDQYENFLRGARTSHNLYAVIDGEYPILPPPLDRFSLEGCHKVSIPKRPMMMCKVDFPP